MFHTVVSPFIVWIGKVSQIATFQPIDHHPLRPPKLLSHVGASHHARLTVTCLRMPITKPPSHSIALTLHSQPNRKLNITSTWSGYRRLIGVQKTMWVYNTTAPNAVNMTSKNNQTELIHCASCSIPYQNHKTLQFNQPTKQSNNKAKVPPIVQPPLPWYSQSRNPKPTLSLQWSELSQFHLPRTGFNTSKRYMVLMDHVYKWLDSRLLVQATFRSPSCSPSGSNQLDDAWDSLRQRSWDVNVISND